MLPIFLLGFMGTGKSHWGKIWAHEMNVSFVDLDREIEISAGKPILDIFEKEGEDYFRVIEAEKLRQQSVAGNTIISTGGGCACFHNNINWMNQNGITVLLQASPPYILNRVLAEKEKRPMIKNLNHSEVLFFIEKKLNERMPFYVQAKFSLPCENLEPGSLQKIFSTLKSSINNA